MKFELGEKKGKGGKTRLTDKCAHIRLNDNKNKSKLFLKSCVTLKLEAKPIAHGVLTQLVVSVIHNFVEEKKNKDTKILTRHPGQEQLPVLPNIQI